MAQQIEWESVSRGGKLLEKAVWVGIRKTGIKISAGFWEAAQINEHNIRYVLIKKNDQHQALLLRFLTPAMVSHMRMQNHLLDGVYTLLPDGGGLARGRKCAGGVLQPTSLIKHTPWLSLVANQGIIERRRYIPERGEGAHEWIVRMTPGFLYETHAHSCDVPYGIKGIYCYVGTKGQVLYIGQGAIRSRFMKHAWEKKIPATKFIWTPIADADSRKNAEDYHLNAHVMQFGELPFYNRTPARSKSKKGQDPNT